MLLEALEQALGTYPVAQHHMCPHLLNACEQAAEAAAESADCVLATHAHLRCGGFPFYRFHRAIEYVQEV